MGRREKNIPLKLKICAKSCCTIWKNLYKYHSQSSLNSRVSRPPRSKSNDALFHEPFVFVQGGTRSEHM